MKYLKIFVVICLIPLIMFGCGKDEPTTNKELLTEERVSILEEKIYLQSEKLNYKALKSSYVDDIISGANARISAGSTEVSDFQSFFRFELSYGEKVNDYEYSVYGTLYGKDNFGYQKFKLVNASFHCEKTAETECNVKFDGFSLGDLK